ncbi:GAF domain-containing protein [Ramlibacter albus]|uniref:GAF domain-containing protein n=1 Tax=Ramlibacter albus TaxID=2079448 RepID=A0A923S594_9BURK|nr:GAF domain-containing protein [Ramlibacter albus]MBC5767723.1 GAF domain-containing protein [Ramlibacter albus]
MVMTALASNLLDALGEARDADTALELIDHARRVIAGPGIFSIQVNVTTARDPKGELRLQRFYASPAAAVRWPVNGVKRKTYTPWTETLFVRGQPFVAAGADTMARAFDDYDQMKAMDIDSVVNVPLMKGNLCYATFNVFGTKGEWQPHQVLALRLLALAAARWVPPAADLMYSFDNHEAAAQAA